MSDKFLIVGLGNPGREYAKTRHNVGWFVIDELVKRYDLGGGHNEKRAIVWNGNINGKKILLAKPLTYMNLSGESVRALMDFYKIELDHLLVIHDDMDTPFGVMRLRKNGGHGGQNGMRNIIQHLGTQDFSRLRFGIGRPPGKMRPVDYVLQTFYGDEEILAQEVVTKAAKGIESWLEEGIDLAMTQHNGDVNEPKAAEPKVKPRDQLKIYQRAHELAPNDPEPLLKLIGVQKQMGQLKKAAENHLVLAEIYEKADEADKAMSERERAASVWAGLIEVHHRIAEDYLKQDNPKKAVNRYLILADYYIEQKDMEHAAEAVELALAINPQHPRAIELHESLMERPAQE